MSRYANLADVDDLVVGCRVDITETEGVVAYWRWRVRLEHQTRERHHWSSYH